MDFISRSTEDTVGIAKEVAEKLKKGDIILYTGGLGAGKTTFTKALAEGLSIESDVCSPTFSLVHEHYGADIKLVHFDLYRITSPEDLYSVGFYDYFDGDCIAVIEWSENCGDLKDLGRIINIDIEYIDENTRCFRIRGADIDTWN